MNKKKNVISDSSKCQKCGEYIGGKAYYIIPLDCMYDGMESFHNVKPLCYVLSVIIS